MSPVHVHFMNSVQRVHKKEKKYTLWKI